MDRRKIEKITASIAVILLFVNTIGAILAAANAFFKWDIFPPEIQTVIYFIFVSFLAIILSSILVNIMLNISIIAINSEHRHQE